jgi:hypothetical protein
MELVNQLTREFVGSPRKAGSRGKPRFGRSLTLPPRVVPPTTRGSHLAKQVNAESPGSEGASPEPTLPVRSPTRRHFLPTPTPFRLQAKICQTGMS